MEPLIKDPSRKGQPLYKGHFQYPARNRFQLPKSLPTMDKMVGPMHSVPLLRGSSVVSPIDSR